MASDDSNTDTLSEGDGEEEAAKPVTTTHSRVESLEGSEAAAVVVAAAFGQAGVAVQ